MGCSKLSNNLVSGIIYATIARLKIMPNVILMSTTFQEVYSFYLGGGIVILAIEK